MSVASGIYEFALGSTGSQWKFRSADNLHFYLRYLRRGVNNQPLPHMYVRYRISRASVAGRSVYYIRPRTIEPKKHMVYVHGGSYVNPMTAGHWAFVQRLIEKTACSVSVPIYGLVPEYDHRAAYDLLQQHYRDLLREHAPENIVLAGDSAGGGLALAFSQWLMGAALPQAGALVMISPWLDVTLSNPAIAHVQKQDSLLAPEGNREAGRLWAAGLDLRDPRVSPLYGPVQGLPPLCLLIGTHDILLPDAQSWRDRAKAAGHFLDYREYPGMFHLWAMAPIPESLPALAQIEAFLQAA